MAVDPTKAKRNIDFNVYEKPDPSQNVNWQEQLSSVATAFSDVAEDRQRRKDEIDADTKTNLDKLNNLDAMDNPTLMNMTIDGANGAANAIYEAEQKMKRGELRPQDFQKLKQNISSGFTQFQKNAKSWDTDFARYTKRLKDGEGSSLEAYLGERMEAFGNLKNLQLVTNPVTGNLAFGRIDENGNLLDGPDDLISINRMTAISKQEIDNVNVGEIVNTTATELGDYITAGNASTMGKDGSARAVVTIDDFMQTPEAETYLRDKAKAVTSSPFSTGSVLADNGVTNSKGEKFRGGDQKDFDEWNAANPGMEDQNPIIVMGYKENGVIVEPTITEGQQKAAEDYFVRSMKAKLGRKEDMKESSFQWQQKSATTLGNEKLQQDNFSYVNQAQQIISGDQEDFNAGVTTLANSYNASNKGKIKPLADNPVDRNSDPNNIVITYADGDTRKVARFEVDSSGNPKLDSNGKKIPRSQQLMNSEVMSYMSPVEGSTDQIYKEYNKANPGGLKDYGGSGKTVNYTGIGDKVIKDTNLGTKMVLVEGSPVKLADRFNTIAKMEGADELLLNEYTTVTSSLLAEELKDLTTNYSVNSDDIFTGTGNKNAVEVTIDGNKTRIEFDSRKEPQKFQSELQKVINNYKKTQRNKKKKGNEAPSDRRLKTNINKIGVSKNGHNIYTFEYRDKKSYGSGVYQGVMAQEVPDAQVKVGDYYHVDYSKVDVTFKQIS